MHDGVSLFATVFAAEDMLIGHQLPTGDVAMEDGGISSGEIAEGADAIQEGSLCLMMCRLMEG